MNLLLRSSHVIEHGEKSLFSMSQTDTPPGPSREKIWKMFDIISPTYDLANRYMTMGCDKIWRKKLSHLLPKSSSLSVLDCATGTGDQIVSLLKTNLNIQKIVGIDLSEEMLKIAKEKLKPYKEKTELLCADLLSLPFAEGEFDCVTISFGIRNVTNVMAALQECRRVLKKGGRILILEGTVPSHRLLAKAHTLYLRHVLPRIGGLISKNQAAYRYLNQTIETFPQGEKFNGKLRAAGFVHVKANPVWGGVVTIYQGDKDLH